MERTIVVKQESAQIISEKARLAPDRRYEDSVQIWAWIHQPHFSKGTKDIYLGTVRKFFEYHFLAGLKEITTAHVSLYLKNLGEMAPSSLNVARSALSSLFHFLWRSGYVAQNPVLPIKTKKVHPNINGKILPAEAISRMIDLEPSDRNKLLMKILYFEALRESEVIQLRPSSFNAVEEGRAKLTVMGKGRKPRTIHVPASVWIEIKEFVRANRIAADEFMFASGSALKTSITRQQVFRIVKAAAKRAGIDPMPSPHWFRHSSSRHALDNGANLNEIRTTLGHSSLATTQIYFGNQENHGNGDFLKIQFGKLHASEN